MPPAERPRGSPARLYPTPVRIKCPGFVGLRRRSRSLTPLLVILYSTDTMQMFATLSKPQFVVARAAPAARRNVVLVRAQNDVNKYVSGFPKSYDPSACLIAREREE